MIEWDKLEVKVSNIPIIICSGREVTIALASISIRNGEPTLLLTKKICDNVKALTHEFTELTLYDLGITNNKICHLLLAFQGLHPINEIFKLKG